MNDGECVEFLRWCLPGLRMRYAGFRKVRRQVCKRISRRMSELRLDDSHSYIEYLRGNPGEWKVLDAMCRVTISRFHRDRGVFDTILLDVLPHAARTARARGDGEISCWCAGCSSGEEAYTLNIIWKLRARSLEPKPGLRITATDTDAALLDRARNGRYPASSLKDLPDDLIDAAFEKSGTDYLLKQPFKEGIRFLNQDLRREMPEESFHLILCRNLAFTYFDDLLQLELLERMAAKMIPGGFLVIGAHEELPLLCGGMTVSPNSRCIFQLAK